MMKKIFNLLKLTSLWRFIKIFISYHLEHSKKIYTCTLLNGYKFTPNGSIELTIKQFGLGNIIFIDASELFQNEHLMRSLNPYDVAKVSFIALGNILSKFPNDQKEEAFKKMLAEIMEE